MKKMLIAALDKKSKKEESPDKVKIIPVKEMKTYSNLLYKDFFSNNYEKRFTKYDDLDKCSEGFKGRRPKILFRPRRKNISVNADIQSLEDLIKLTDKYPIYDYITYDINMKGLHKIKPYLENLLSFVGLDELKETVLDQLIYFMHSKSDDYLHTVLYGPPGTGKTEVAKILGKIYTKLGILEKGTFVKVTRSDFVAGYLGQTAIKTRNLIESNLGGVIFIDEAYAMGNQEKRDSFSKEALDTLCELLSDHKRDLMVIIAGYREELDSCFFSYNPGLESRFAWQFQIHEYNAEQLSLIFKKKVEDAKWVLEEDVANTDWFEKHKDSFKNYGRDVENLFSKCKICHFRRIFGKKETQHSISHQDLERGFEKYKNFNKHGNNKKESCPNFMYT